MTKAQKEWFEREYNSLYRARARYYASGNEELAKNCGRAITELNRVLIHTTCYHAVELDVEPDEYGVVPIGLVKY